MEHSIVHLKHRHATPRWFHGVKSLGRTVSFQDEKCKACDRPFFRPATVQSAMIRNARITNGRGACWRHGYLSGGAHDTVVDAGCAGRGAGGFVG